METERYARRGIGTPRGEMKRQAGKKKNNKRVGKMEKVFNRCVVLPADSSLFCFITSALCSAGCTVSVAEVVWRHCGLAEAWK